MDPVVLNKPVRESSLGNLTQRIVQDLGTAIITGEFNSETPFPVEAEICKRYDASRSVVREAVKVLNAKGLVTARPRRGTQVRPEQEWNLLDADVLNWILKRRFSLPLLVDFTRTRLAIEPVACAEAARTGTEEQHQKISAGLQRLRDSAVGKDHPLEADISFHLAILEASNNQFFMHMRPMVETALRFAIRFTNDEQDIKTGKIPEHEAIAEPILRRDEQAAHNASRLLLEDNLRVMLESKEARRLRESGHPL